MSSPTLGRIVLFRLYDNQQDINGAREFPAIITAVHSETCVNLKVFADAEANLWMTSIEFHPEDSGHAGICFFPPRN